MHAAVYVKDSFEHSNASFAAEISSIHVMNLPFFNRFGRKHGIFQELRFVLRVDRVMIANLKNLIAFDYDFFFVIKSLLNYFVAEILFTFGLKAVSLDQILSNE